MQRHENAFCGAGYSQFRAKSGAAMMRLFPVRWPVEALALRRESWAQRETYVPRSLVHRRAGDWSQPRRGSEQGFEGLLDALGVDTLEADLLPDAAGAFLVGADVVVVTLEAAFEQFGAQAAAQAGLDVKALGDQ